MPEGQNTVSVCMNEVLAEGIEREVKKRRRNDRAHVFLNKREESFLSV